MVVTPIGAIIEELVCVEDDKPNNRFNDAKCDANSRLWAGTMSLTAEKNEGNLYSYYEGIVMHEAVH